MNSLWKNFRLGIKLVVSYIAQNKKAFAIGFVASLLFVFLSPKLSPLIFRPPAETIGMVGNYTVSTLPRPIQDEISFGLVRLDDRGLATPGAAGSWVATDSGKVVEFNLRPDLSWQDGEKLTAGQINYNLRGVEITKSNDTIRLSMREPFSPLVTLLSQPLFKNGLVGLGENTLKELKFNGRFLSSLTLFNRQSGQTKIYKFYPSEKGLLEALKLGAVRKMEGLHYTFNLEDKPGYKVTSSIENNTEAIIFFNNQKKPFDDKSFRQGLMYALPDDYTEGETASSPLPRNNWALSDSVKVYPHNIETAKRLLEKQATESGSLSITLSTTRELAPTALKIASAWQEAGVETKVETTDLPPVNYDVYLSYIDLPLDPDQYALWHSTQSTNIAGYRSFKADKLLEEGRTITDEAARKDTYANFQRAISEDAPAAFLFYPKVYTITRGN